MKIKDLKKYEKNPRKITDQAKKLLEKALLEFGDLSGVVFNKKTNRLVGGHQRQDAFNDNYEIVITNKYDAPNEFGTIAIGYIDVKGERFSYREVMWDEPKEILANIAANKGAGSWDYGLLQEHFVSLDALNLDLDLTMFSSEERDNLFGEWDSDIEALDKIEENLDGIEGKIKITCPMDIKDEVLIFLKAKLLETSFEGVHIE